MNGPADVRDQARHPHAVPVARRRGGRARPLGVGLALGLCVACGKKGPPLAPLVPIPAGVEAVSAQRVGGDVYVTLTLPAENVDEYTPADLGRVEVYGYTGRTPPPRGRIVEYGTLVATIPVAPPPPEPGEEPAPEAAALPEAPLQGAGITIRDTLTADELVQGKAVAVAAPGSRGQGATTAAGEALAVAGARPAAAPPRPPGLTRYYTALPYSTRGRPGPPGAMAELPLVPAPAAPPAVEARYDERSVTVAWAPSGGLLGFVLDRALVDEPLPLAAAGGVEPALPDAPPPPVQYNVYRDVLPDPLAPPPREPAAPWNEAPPQPLNPLPLAAFDFTDSVEFGRRRCYAVRAVRGAGPAALVGDASPLACVTPVDTFAPAPPAGLAAVASEGAVSLIWEPSADIDLAGYLVLRGDAAGDTLQPLTPAPVTEARFRDERIVAGQRYVYAVVAVDNRFPLPNVSAESSRVEETAR